MIPARRDPAVAVCCGNRDQTFPTGKTTPSANGAEGTMKGTDVSAPPVRIGLAERRYAERLDRMPGVTRIWPPLADRRSW
jgi:hypothetical protein